MGVGCQPHSPAASTHGKDLVPTVQEPGWTPGPVWMGGKSRPHRDSILDCPARNQSLYQLSYPANPFYSPSSKYHGDLGYDSTDNDLHDDADSRLQSKFLPPWKPWILVSVVYISIMFFMATTWTCQMSVTTTFNIMYHSVTMLTFRSSEPLTRWLVITVLSLYKQGSSLRLLYVKAGWCLGLIPAAWAHKPVRYTSSKWNKGVLRAAW